MPLEIHIDDPDDRKIQYPLCRIRGWCAFDSAPALRRLEFRIAGTKVPYSRVARPDVEEAHAGKTVIGFLLDLDLSFYLSGVRMRELVLQVLPPDEPEVGIPFCISREAMGLCLGAASGT